MFGEGAAIADTADVRSMRTEQPALNDTCVAISASDGLWRTVQCNTPMPVACRAVVGVAAARQATSWLSRALTALAGGLRLRPQGVRDPMWVLGRPPDSLATMHADLAPATGGCAASWLQRLSTFRQKCLFAFRTMSSNLGALSLHGQALGAVASSDAVPDRDDGCGGCCPLGFDFAYPENGKSNAALQQLLQSKKQSSAMLRLRGPNFD
jgi:hypothetical protein